MRTVDATGNRDTDVLYMPKQVYLFLADEESGEKSNARNVTGIAKMRRRSAMDQHHSHHVSRGRGPRSGDASVTRCRRGAIADRDNAINSPQRLNGEKPTLTRQLVCVDSVDPMTLYRHASQNSTHDTCGYQQ